MFRRSPENWFRKETKKMKKDMILCLTWGAVALAAGCACHRLAPGLGLVLMPMFWPLAVLATRVPVAKAAATAAAVPFVSLLLTGMPALPILVAVKFAVLTVAAGLLWRLLAGLRRH